VIMQHESHDMTDEQRQRSNALAAANINRTGMSFDEQITMAEYIYAGWSSLNEPIGIGIDDVIADAEGRDVVFVTDTTVTDVG